jgi:hypothetical protein
MAKTGLLRLCWLILSFLLLASLAWAAAVGSPIVDWEVLGGGGAPAVSSSGSVHLNGTLGQTAIGPSQGGDTDLGAGFWYGLSSKETTRIYLPIVCRGY